MRIGDLLYYQQPTVFKKLISIFQSGSPELEPPRQTTNIEIRDQPEFAEDDPEFCKYRNIMTERKAVPPK